jgi:hypothetical protein
LKQRWQKPTDYITSSIFNIILHSKIAFSSSKSPNLTSEANLQTPTKMACTNEIIDDIVASMEKVSSDEESGEIPPIIVPAEDESSASDSSESKRTYIREDIICGVPSYRFLLDFMPWFIKKQKHFTNGDLANISTLRRALTNWAEKYPQEITVDGKMSYNILERVLERIDVAAVPDRKENGLRTYDFGTYKCYQATFEPLIPWLFQNPKVFVDGTFKISHQHLLGAMATWLGDQNITLTTLELKNTAKHYLEKMGFSVFHSRKYDFAHLNPANAPTKKRKAAKVQDEEEAAPQPEPEVPRKKLRACSLLAHEWSCHSCPKKSHEPARTIQEVFQHLAAVHNLASVEKTLSIVNFFFTD